MPFARTVRKQNYLLPLRDEFAIWPVHEKRNILKNLSVDNLILYIEYILTNDMKNLNIYNGQIIIEQIIAEDDPKRGNISDFISCCKNYSSIVQEWINRHINDFHIVELEQVNDKMNSKAFHPTFDGGSFQNQFPDGQAAGGSKGESPFMAMNGGGKDTAELMMTRFHSFDQQWNNGAILPNTSRWQNNLLGSVKGQTPASSAAAVAPPQPLMEKKNPEFVKPNPVDKKKPVWPFRQELAFNSLQPGPSTAAAAALKQPDTKKELISFGSNLGNHLERSWPFNNNNNNPEDFGTDGGGGSTTIHRLGSINLESKDLKLFEHYKLPPPAIFNNHMSVENRAKLLSALPINVRNKYELFCWSTQIVPKEQENGRNGGPAAIAVADGENYFTGGPKPELESFCRENNDPTASRKFLW